MSHICSHYIIHNYKTCFRLLSRNIQTLICELFRLSWSDFKGWVTFNDSIDTSCVLSNALGRLLPTFLTLDARWHCWPYTSTLALELNWLPRDTAGTKTLNTTKSSSTKHSWQTAKKNPQASKTRTSKLKHLPPHPRLLLQWTLNKMPALPLIPSTSREGVDQWRNASRWWSLHFAASGSSLASNLRPAWKEMSNWETSLRDSGSWKKIVSRMLLWQGYLFVLFLSFSGQLKIRS